ncbi:MAG: 30S ribosomal protein S8 [Planctomycetes bacterium]|nr:30S ribosomal protein S8 [Planctomycetota bacterium]
MSMTDPIADMLTRIRNAVRNKSAHVTMPSSRIKVNIAKVLKDEGYIREYSVQEHGGFAHLIVDLKFDEDGHEVIREIKRFSKPGCRKYRGVDDLPKVLGGLGITVLSTNRGVMSDRKARELKIGGEVICTVY